MVSRSYITKKRNEKADCDPECSSDIIEKMMVASAEIKENQFKCFTRKRFECADGGMFERIKITLRERTGERMKEKATLTRV